MERCSEDWPRRQIRLMHEKNRAERHCSVGRLKRIKVPSEPGEYEIVIASVRPGDAVQVDVGSGYSWRPHPLKAGWVVVRALWWRRFLNSLPKLSAF